MILEERLIFAINEHDVVEAKKLACLVQQVNYIDQDRESPLLCAARQGLIEIVELLLAKGADPNITNYNDETALFHAFENDHMAIAQILLKHELTDPNILFRDGPCAKLTLIFLHSMRGDSEKVKILLKHQNTDPNIECIDSTPLLIAIGFRNKEVAKILLRDARTDINLTDEEGQTAFDSFLSDKNKIDLDAEILELFLQKGQDIRLSKEHTVLDHLKDNPEMLEIIENAAIKQLGEKIKQGYEDLGIEARDRDILQKILLTTRNKLKKLKTEQSEQEERLKDRIQDIQESLNLFNASAAKRLGKTLYVNPPDGLEINESIEPWGRINPWNEALIQPEIFKIVIDYLNTKDLGRLEQVSHLGKTIDNISICTQASNNQDPQLDQDATLIGAF